MYYLNGSACELLRAIEPAKNLIIESNVTSIRDGAFAGCDISVLKFNGAPILGSNILVDSKVGEIYIFDDTLEITTDTFRTAGDVKFYVSSDYAKNNGYILESNGQVIILNAVDGYTVSYDYSECAPKVSVTDPSIVGGTFKATVEFSDGYTAHDVVVYLNGKVVPLSGKQLEADFGEAKDVLIKIISKPRLSKDNVQITFYADSETIALQLAKGLSIVNTDIPTVSKINNDFCYWADKDGNVFDFANAVEDNLDLYAVWTTRDPVLTFSSPAGYVTVNGKVLQGSVSGNDSYELFFTPYEGYVPEFWIVDGVVRTAASEKLFLSDVKNDAVVSISYLYYSLSSDVITLTNRGLPTGEEISSLVEVANLGGIVNTSGEKWTGHASVPLIVGNTIYFRAGNYLCAAESDTGYVFKSVPSLETTAYYHYLAYGNGIIIDCVTGIAYDLELNQLFTLSRTWPSFTYTDGFFYSAGSYVYCFSAIDEDKGRNDEVKELIKVGDMDNVYSSYGATQTVIVDHYLYRAYADVSNGDRGIIALDLTNGESKLVLLPGIRGLFLDDGWISYSDGTMYLTAYKHGLFTDVADSQYSDAIAYVNVRGMEFGTPGYYYYGKEFIHHMSEFVVYDRLGFVNAGNTLFVFKMNDDGSIGEVITQAGSVFTHGSITLDVSYYESTGSIYIYLIPYNGTDTVTGVIMEYKDGELTRYITNSMNRNYGSQAMRADIDGRMVFYNDSGHIFIYTVAEKNAYYLFLQDGNTGTWVKAYGSDVYDAMRSLGNIMLSDGKIVAVNGDYSAYNLWALSRSSYEKFTEYDWIRCGDASSVFSASHYFVISNLVASPDDSEVWTCDGKAYKLREAMVNHDLLNMKMSSDKTYNKVVIGDHDNGTVGLSGTYLDEGATVTVTPIADYEYSVGKVTYTVEGGEPVEIAPVDGVYTFVMPGANVTVAVVFEPVPLYDYDYYFDLGGTQSSELVGDLNITDYGGKIDGTIKAMNIAEAFKKAAEKEFGTYVLGDGSIVSINGLFVRQNGLFSKENTGFTDDVHFSIVTYVLEDGKWKVIENLLDYEGGATSFAFVFQPWTADTEEVNHTFHDEKDAAVYEKLKVLYGWAGWGYLGTPFVNAIDVSVSGQEHGKVEVPFENAVPGTVVTVGCTADDHYEAVVKVMCDGKEIPVVDGRFVMPEGAVTVNVEFVLEKYTVTFMNGDEVFETFTITYGEKVVKPAGIPADLEEGKVFVRWEGFNSEIAVTEDMVFKAVIENGKTEENGNVSYEKTEEDGSTTTGIVDKDTGASTETNVKTEGKTETTTETKKDSDGNTTSVVVDAVINSTVVTKQDIESVIENIQKAVTENPDVKVDKTITIQSTDSVASVTAESIKAIADAGATLEMAVGESTEVVLAPEVLQKITGASTEKVSVSVEPVKKAMLNVKQQKVVGDSPVFELSATVGSKVLHNEMKGTVVTVPYVLEGGNAADLCVWFINDDGNIEKVKDVIYNAEDKTVTFTVEHFSKYAIGFGLTSYVPEDDNTVMVLAIIVVIVVAFTAAMLLSIRRIEKQSL
ncbi:MAG: hypothetical protein MJZ21_02105 [archaeon]|nr:hypothetical protein [archaeon]